MANNRVENERFDENGATQSTNFRAKELSSRTQSVKKQAFGELKNVMYKQQLDNTPFRRDVPTPKCDTAKSIRKDAFQRLKPSQQQHLENTPFKLATPIPSFDSAKSLRKAATTPQQNVKVNSQEQQQWCFEDMDMERTPCPKDCEKSTAEIWGDMNMINDSLLNNVINGGKLDSDDELDSMNFDSANNISCDVYFFGPTQPTIGLLESDCLSPVSLPNMDNFCDDFDF